MKSVKFLSMTFILLGFVKCLLNREPYKGVDVRSLETKISKIKTLFSL